MSSFIGFIISVAALLIFGWGAYMLSFDAGFLGHVVLVPKSMRIYGQWKYLTYHCSLMQVINAILHIGAYFCRSLKKPRDLWFTTLAYPVGSIVVYTFWGVWLIIGREFIYPEDMAVYSGPWLNHATHTVIAPINILLAIFVSHKYTRNAVLLTVGYFATYTAWLFHIKHKSGYFVYGYLEQMNAAGLAIYFSAVAIFCYLIYKSGQLLESVLHSKATQRPIINKPKQK